MPLQASPGLDLPLICVCSLEGQSECDRLRSYSSIRSLTFCEAGWATSASPLYFPPITIAGCRYFDGGMESSNPVLEAVREASQEYPNRTIAAIVCIGTGMSEPASPSGGLLNFINSIVYRVTDTEVMHKWFLEYYPGLRSVYFRLQEMCRLDSIDLADW
jgi:hypothetical protein